MYGSFAINLTVLTYAILKIVIITYMYIINQQHPPDPFHRPLSQHYLEEEVQFYMSLYIHTLVDIHILF